VARAQQEAEFLSGELARAVALGGQSRKAAGASARARVNVTKVLGRTIEKIAAGNPTLGQHLSALVRRGLYCSYAPDPRLAFRWEV
jgi:translation elongation factor EF-4